MKTNNQLTLKELATRWKTDKNTIHNNIKRFNLRDGRPIWFRLTDGSPYKFPLEKVELYEKERDITPQTESIE